METVGLVQAAYRQAGQELRNRHWQGKKPGKEKGPARARLSRSLVCWASGAEQRAQRLGERCRQGGLGGQALPPRPRAAAVSWGRSWDSGIGAWIRFHVRLSWGCAQCGNRVPREYPQTGSGSCSPPKDLARKQARHRSCSISWSKRLRGPPTPKGRGPRPLLCARGGPNDLRHL